MTQTQAERIATFVHFRRLADDARPQDDADYGSERQLNAENLFFSELEIKLPSINDEAFIDWCLKATSEEMLDEAMRKIGDHLAVTSQRHLVSMDEITEFLRQQAEGRAPENDEAGLLLNARDLIIKGMEDL